MGKAKKRLRASKRSTNPLPRNTAKDEQAKLKKILPLLEKLHSDIANDRSMALGSISVLCEDAYIRDLLLRQKLVQLVMTKLLSDENTEIMVDAYGLLRNLCLDVGYDVSMHVWRSDIWTHINSGFGKLLESLPSLAGESKATAESKRLLFDFGDNLISLVVALADSSEDIFSALMANDKLDLLLHVVCEILKYGLPAVQGKSDVTLRITTQLFNSILDFIYTFSSESGDFIELIGNHSYLSEFLIILPSLTIKNGNELTMVLTQGILLQIMEVKMKYEEIESLIRTTCSAIEHIDLQSVKADLQPLEENSDLTTGENVADVSQKIKNYTSKRSAATMKLQTLELSLDIITASTELIAAKHEEGHHTVPESLMNVLTEGLPIVYQALEREFSSRLLVSWNNLLWLFLTLNVNLFELRNEPWKRVWEFINNVDNKEPGNRIGKLRCLCALLKSIQLQESPSQYLEALQCNDVNFCNLVFQEFSSDESLDKDEIFELKQSCCNVLGVIGAFQNQVDVNKMVGDFFIQLLSNNTTPPRLLVDVLNHFIDIYSDAAFDYDEPVFVQAGYLTALKDQVVPNLRTSFKFVDKNKDPVLKADCQDAFNMLDSFIHYKEKERL
ncbi:HCL230Wp [Eremothecium sinecaudum]|uniref:HCL230Wp n=1 Tax=Eremothecium sinecaudum TaxID=45286 RepID=A0A120K1Z5_9SACH|nr:HCL230Wp [Eremothecium sinecaudum]AMD19921.1 HCL230Wp [Eremothecium sinecaudum]